jgi:hypothetical protein
LKAIETDLQVLLGGVGPPQEGIEQAFLGVS